MQAEKGKESSAGAQLKQEGNKSGKDVKRNIR
jgi:hypothetical protein